ncbi:hypothetical protein [Aeromonas hydrophila]|uniref:hypothetical protein n=1 Tax=Aeromonas hydrophila TaxID=644 RepID=UPI000A9138A8|nr:hypothetical protein [Aeromonas hydrophila]
MNIKINKFKGERPYCSDVIDFHELKFMVVNDDGEMICRCMGCNNSFSIQCKNPDESYIVSGAEKVDYLDYEVQPPSNIKKLKVTFKYDGDIFKSPPKFDSNKYKLYQCHSCSDNIEKLAHDMLHATYSEWGQQVYRYISEDISGYGYDADKCIINVDFTCSCGENHTALFYKKFNHESFSGDDFLLGNISNTINLNDRVDGIITKENFIELIKKLIVRWEFIFDKTFLIFPYVGHTRSSNMEILNLWEQIISQSSSDKLKIITKTQTLNAYKKSVSETVHDYEILSKYKFTPQSIESAIKNTTFHAKIYCGVSSNYVECLSGSANIATGPSNEQLTFKNYDSYEMFYGRYLQTFDTLKVADEVFQLSDVNNPDDCHVMLIQKEHFAHSRLYKKDLVNLLSQNE